MFQLMAFQQSEHHFLDQAQAAIDALSRRNEQMRTDFYYLFAAMEL